MNVLTLSGNLGGDCRTGMAGQTAVCNFSVAMKSGYGDKATTIWVDCALFGKRAESGLVQYLTKGQTVVVSGELGTREHEGKTYVTCKVSEVTLVGSKSEQQPPHQAGFAQPAPQQQPPQQQGDPWGQAAPPPQQPPQQGFAQPQQQAQPSPMNNVPNANDFNQQPDQTPPF